MSNLGSMIHSVESACTTFEANALLQLMAAFIKGSPDAFLAGGKMDASIHDIPGHTAREAAAVYEPNGRIECTMLPPEAVKLLDDIFADNIEAIQYAFPEAVRNNGWVYLAYGPGQFVNPHVDYHGRIGDPWPGVLGTLSLSVRTAEVGGEFFVESSGDGAVWESPLVARRGLDWSSPSFREQRRIRWTAQHAPGDMLLWGSQVIHGTMPVGAGQAAKFLTQLLSAEQGQE